MSFWSESLFAVQQFCESLSEFEFLRQALMINLITGLVTAPMGVLLILRRMTLMGDALSHALLPGVAFSYFFFGSSALAMTLGGFAAGLLIILLTVWAQKHSPLKEDSNFAAFYLLSLAIGVLTISQRGSSSDLMHILFGSPLTASKESLQITTVVCVLAAPVFWLLHRFFVLEIFDATYLLARGYRPLTFQMLFLLLVMASLVVSFQTNGTLLAMGQLVLPAIISQLWSQRILPITLLALILSTIGSVSGLFLSYQMDWPLGPSTLLIWGLLHILSLFLNPKSGLLRTVLPRKHYES